MARPARVQRSHQTLKAWIKGSSGLNKGRERCDARQSGKRFLKDETKRVVDVSVREEGG